MPTSLRWLALLCAAGLTWLIIQAVTAPDLTLNFLTAGVSVFYLLWLALVLVHHTGRTRTR